VFEILCQGDTFWLYSYTGRGLTQGFAVPPKSFSVEIAPSESYFLPLFTNRQTPIIIIKGVYKNSKRK
jgi:hypothetical protein